MKYKRDQMMYAAVLGWFSFCWFGWAQADPRADWRIWIALADGIALLVSFAGGILSFRNWHKASALDKNSSWKWYLIFLISEFVLALIGAVFLISKNQINYISLWISFVVAIHFFGLKFVFRDYSLFVLGGIMLLMTIIAHPLANYFNVDQSAIIGIANGFCLLVFALIGLRLGLRKNK
ncbi:hypothetical protein [Oenococcus oeni]|uniref:hypothetical protein n=1 Tax=Oenococcus oeni TaxID=1247 RepID=UPI000277B258|nr:hypothetical protein [Oenococcus oeni]EJN99356.1 hypothetical protein AWRIB418_1626 [Oenococcus oeni AWRIB418]KGH87392.1 hypothetical protein X350_09125 [Oenococcus oeni S12]OIM42440.1 hypothetical protein ATX72_00905 [Oenococcus oeni]QGR00741.1 hypothetical protein E4R25_02035 [Oenococcus oeni]TEU20075.1 hypothetical protein E2146_07570 [Oenococcus oeni]